MRQQLCVCTCIFIHSQRRFQPRSGLLPDSLRYLADRHHGSTRGASDVLDLPARESSRACPAPHVLAWTSADPADPPPGRTSLRNPGFNLFGLGDLSSSLPITTRFSAHLWLRTELISVGPVAVRMPPVLSFKVHHVPCPVFGT